ncbi:MAG: hypothetical protein JKY52_15400 [Flavobacteriales bacterium]|nr:hypothetical protein [Flavobacteriales bacterium]
MKKMQIKTRSTALLVLLLSVQNVLGQDTQPSSWKERLHFGLISEIDMAYEFKGQKLQKSEFIFKPELAYKFNKKVKVVGRGRIYAELSDNLDPGEPSQLSVSDFNKRLLIGDRTEVELRELYVHARVWKTINLRIGKQQIVWGETDGLKLLDVINPQYFREFILDDFEDSRIPLWSVKAEFPIRKLKVQLLWMPDQTYHSLIDPAAPFFPKSVFPVPPPGIQTALGPPGKPNDIVRDSDVGIKLSALIKGWDITANYLYYYDDFPVFYNSLSWLSTGEPLITINPKYERHHLLGATFNKPIKFVTLRGEVGYTLDQNFASTDPSAPMGIVQSDQLGSAIGLDVIKGENIISAQVFANYLIRDVPAFNRDRVEWNVSLLLSREFMNDSFKAEAIWVHSTNHGDGMLRPKLSYWLSSNVQVLLSGDIFYGNEEQLFGQFTDRSRVSTGFVWGI